MPHFDLPDGRSFDLRPFYLSDKLKISEINEREGLTGLQQLTEYVALLESATTSKSWEGSLVDMPENWLAQIARDWIESWEAWGDQVIPPASGTASPSSSPLRASRRGQARHKR